MLQYTPDTKIVVTTTVPLTIQKVWEFYTLPEHITKWNFASEDWHCPSASNDLRVGGKYIARMESKDGKMGFDYWGVYDEIELYKKIFYTLGDGRKVEILFSEKDNSTTVQINFDPETVHSRELQRAGWQAILDNFKKYCETQK
ncbi:MAG: SRPBCC family protein [Leptospiraceae bacterium]|nr:SRPBCC family protein [Leptospiraceae bacterium]